MTLRITLYRLSPLSRRLRRIHAIGQEGIRP